MGASRDAEFLVENEDGGTEERVVVAEVAEAQIEPLSEIAKRPAADRFEGGEAKGLAQRLVNA